MTEVRAAAPGKFLLLGEYAVLEGAPALVMAVDRQARVRVAASAGSVVRVSAPDLGLEQIPMLLGEDGIPGWQAESAAVEKLSLVDQTFRGLARDGLALPPGRGFSLELDTSAFFDAGGAKLGLGSSAALTVALASALAVFAGRGAVTSDRGAWLRRLLHLHREFQGGRGSGMDVAASLVGGLLGYRLAGDSVPHCEALAWPAGVHIAYVWTGSSASTAAFLGRLAQWREAHAGAYAAHMRELGAIAAAAAAAVRAGQARAVMETFVQYTLTLDAFAADCGLDIFSPPHRRLQALAQDCGVGYKPCGAGGGDFGALFALEPQALARAELLAAQAGFSCIPLAVDEYGLELQYE